MPAGTGVWVVNTVPARTAASAWSKSRPSPVTSSRMRSRPRKPAWPSLVWNTSARGGRSAAVRAHGAHAADAGQDLLPDAVVLVAAVEAVGDAAQVRVVLLDVGVEQQQRDAADLRPPDLGRAAPGRPAWPRAPGSARRTARRAAPAAGRAGPGRGSLDLPAVQRQRLAEYLAEASYQHQ